MDAFFSSLDKHLIVETNIDGLTTSNFPIFYANLRAKALLSKRISEFLNRILKGSKKLGLSYSKNTKIQASQSISELDSIN